MLTENQKKIRQWRNERVNKKGIRSQAEYDDRHKFLSDLKQQLLEGLITKQQAALELVCKYHYGSAGAAAVINKWEVKHE